MYERSCVEGMRWLEAFLYQGPEPIEREHTIMPSSPLGKGLGIEADKTPWYTVVYDPVARRVERVFGGQFRKVN